MRTIIQLAIVLALLAVVLTVPQSVGQIRPDLPKTTVTRLERLDLAKKLLIADVEHGGIPSSSADKVNQVKLLSDALIYSYDTEQK